MLKECELWWAWNASMSCHDNVYTLVSVHCSWTPITFVRVRIRPQETEILSLKFSCPFIWLRQDSNLLVG